MRQPTSILAYLARRFSTGIEYLLLHRVPISQTGLEAFWQGVTGGLEDNEEPPQAAKRELLEETGISPDRINPIGYNYTFPIQEKWKHFYPPGADTIVEHCFLAECFAPIDLRLSKEHDLFQWCTIDEAMGLLLFPNSKKALRLCHKIMTGSQ
jgi:dATP pyrophosphohydrolase